MRTAKIWITAPHEEDGFFVELLEPLSSRNKDLVQLDSAWFPSTQACYEWAIANGAMKVENV